MSAPLSSSTLSRQLSLQVSPSASRAALFDFGASAGSFSQTLQNRMETPPPQQQSMQPPSPPAREPARTPEQTSARNGASAPAPREPENTGSSASAESAPAQPPAKGAEKTADGTPDRDTEANASTQAADAAQDSGEAAASAQDEAGESARTAGAEVLLEAGADETAQVAAQLAAGAQAGAATPPTDPAALAALPAAIAALLSGRQPADGTAADAAAGAEDGAMSLFERAGSGKGLQDSALMSKNGAGAQLMTGERAATAPGFILQGRELAAAITASRSAGGAPGISSVQGEAGNAGATQQSGAGLHLHAPHALFRQAAPNAAATPQLPVYTPAGQQGWAEDVGNQVRWMLGRAESKAELVLTPPNMGKLEVSINLNGDQTTAQFIASSQAARDALERAMPQLREMLQQAGIMLGDANVSTSDRGAGGEERGSGQGQNSHGADMAGNAGTPASGNGTVWLRQQQGMVDTFA